MRSRLAKQKTQFINPQKMSGPQEPSNLEIQETPVGKGVFTLKARKPQEHILTFHGPIVYKTQIPDILAPEEDRYIQISTDTYLGPSHSYDDYVNHSCNPNCGIHIQGEKMTLIAIQAIKKNEEITWDYSTTIDEDDWEMDCRCGAPQCRKKIRDFKHLPTPTKKRYIALQIIPPFILKANPHTP